MVLRCLVSTWQVSVKASAADLRGRVRRDDMPGFRVSSAAGLGVGLAVRRLVGRIERFGVGHGPRRPACLGLVAANLLAHLRGQCLELLDYFGVLVGDVGRLADVLVELIQAGVDLGIFRAALLAQGLRLRDEGQFPRPLPHRLEVVAGEIVVRLAWDSMLRPNSTGDRSRPSITGSAGTLPPARATKVGSTSIVPATTSLLLLGAIFPGHHTRVGLRTPPSQVLPLPPRSGLGCRRRLPSPARARCRW